MRNYISSISVDEKLPTQRWEESNNYKLDILKFVVGKRAHLSIMSMKIFPTFLFERMLAMNSFFLNRSPKNVIVVIEIIVATMYNTGVNDMKVNKRMTTITYNYHILLKQELKCLNMA